MKKAMSSEAMMTSGVAATMVAGEKPTVISIMNGIVSISCMDPADRGKDLIAFTLPDMGKDDAGGCMGATVSKQL